MLKAGPFSQFIAELNPQSSPARQAFYNWLIGCAGPHAPVTRELFEQFFSEILAYPHWASNKAQMGAEVRSLIEQFNRFGQGSIDTAGLRFPEEMQVLELEQAEDAAAALNAYFKKTLPSESKFRLIEDVSMDNGAAPRFIAVVLQADRSLQVRVFDAKFTIRDGALEPLRKNLTVHYDPRLQLSARHQQQIEIAPFVTARFAVEDGRVHGRAWRGFMFQNVLEMKGEALADLPRLGFPLRRLEQYFVDRRTDREYQDLVRKADRTLNLLRAGDAEAGKWAGSILAQVEAAYEQIYTEDHRLALLIRDLRHALPAEGSHHVQIRNEI